MGVARFVGVNLDQILSDIQQSGVSEFEKRRRVLDIEIAISKAIRSVLGPAANATAGQVNAAIQNQVVNPYDNFVRNPGTPWPFPRAHPQ
jgi:hypothetical protein